MKKSLFLATAGFAGLLLGTPQNNAQAEVNLNINIGGPRYVGNYGPDFIYLDDYGFAVSWGWDYDVIKLGNFYFIYRDGGWFRSPNYRGPWAAVSYWNLPYQLRRYRWNDIRRRRDREYYRYDRAYWDRYFREQRMKIQRDDRDRQFDSKSDGRPDFRSGDKRLDNTLDLRKDDARPGFKPMPLLQTQPQPQGVPDEKPDGKWFNSKGSDGKDFDRKDSDEKSFERKSFEGKSFGGKNSDGRRLDDSSFERKDSDGKSSDRKSFEGKGSDDKDSKDNSNGKSDNSGRIHGNPDGGWNQVR